MAKYHVGCGLAGIYAGVLKNVDEWKDKTECTREAISAVRDYMVDTLLGGIKCPNGYTGSYQWTLNNGKRIRLTISVIDEFNPFNEISNAC